MTEGGDSGYARGETASMTEGRLRVCQEGDCGYDRVRKLRV